MISLPLNKANSHITQHLQHNHFNELIPFDHPITFSSMSELTKEKLLEYVKKQKLKIKQLENKNNELEETIQSIPQNYKDQISFLENELSLRDAEIHELRGILTTRPSDDLIGELNKTIQSLEYGLADCAEKLKEEQISSAILRGQLEEFQQAGTVASVSPCQECAKLAENLSSKEQELKKASDLAVKYKSIVKSKMKEIEQKEKELERLRGSVEQMTAAETAAVEEVREIVCSRGGSDANLSSDLSICSRDSMSIDNTDLLAGGVLEAVRQLKTLLSTEPSVEASLATPTRNLLTNEVTSLQSQVEELKREVGLKQELKARVKKTFAELTRSKDELKKKLEGQVSALQQEKEELECRLQEASSQQKEDAQRCCQLQERVIELEGLLREAEGHLVEASGREGSEKQRCLDEMSRLSAESDSLRAELNEWIEKGEQLEKSLQAAKSERDDALDTVKATQAELESLSGSFERKLMEFDEATKSNTAAQSRLEALIVEKEASTKECNNLREMIQTLESQLSEEAGLKEKLGNLEVTHDKVLQQLREESSCREEELKEKVEAASEQVVMLEKELAGARDKIASLKREIDEFRQQNVCASPTVSTPSQSTSSSKSGKKRNKRNKGGGGGGAVSSPGVNDSKQQASRGSTEVTPMDQLKATLVAKEEETVRTLSELDSKSKEISDYKIMLEKAEDNNKALDSRISELQADLAAATVNLKESEARARVYMEESSRKEEELLSKITALEQMSNEAIEKENTLRDRLKGMQIELTDAQDKLSAAEASQNREHEAALNAEEEASRLQREIDVLTDKMNTECANLRGVVDDQSARITRLESERESISDEHIAREKDLESEIAALTSTNSTLETEKSAAENELCRTRAQVEELQKSLDTALESQSMESESQRQRLQEVENEVSTLRQKLSDSSSAYISESDDLKKKIISLEATVDEMTEEQGNYVDSIAQLESELKEKESVVAATAKEVKDINDLVKSRDAEISSLREELESIRSKAADDINEKIASREKDLQNQITLLSSTNSTLETERSAAENELCRARAQVEELQKSLDTALESQSMESESQRQRLQEVENEVSTLRQKLSDSSSAYISESDDLKKKIISLEATVDEMTEEQGNYVDSIAQLESELKEKESVVAATAKEVKDINDLVKSRDAEISSLREELESIRSKAADDSGEKVTDMEQKLSSLQVQLEQQHSSHILQCESMTKMINDLEEKCKIYEADVTQARDRATELESDLSEATAALSDLTEELDSLRSSLTSKEEELSTAKESVVSIQASFDQFKRDFEVDSRCTVAEHETLENNLAVARKQVVDMEAKIKALETEIVELTGRGDAATQQQIEAMEDRLQREKEDSKAQIGVLTEKVKRLKVLLAKSRDMAQEKEQEMLSIGSAAAAPWKTFRIICRVEASSTGGNDSDGDMKCMLWCLLYRNCTAGKSGSKSGGMPSYRWVEETVVRQWEEEKSCQAVTHWPDTIQEEHRKREERQRTEADAQCIALKKEIDDISQKFQSYKAKAQTALKRLGRDEHSERQRLRNEEETQLKELHDRISYLENCIHEGEQREMTLESSKSIVDQANRELKQQVETLQANLQSQQSRLEDYESELLRSNEVKKNAEMSRQKLEEEITQLRETLNKGSTREASPLPVACPVSKNIKTIESREERSVPTQDSHQSPLTSNSEKSQDESRDDRPHSIHDNDDNERAGLVAMSQTTRNLHDTIVELRAELSSVTVDRNDLQNIVALNEDQINVLKTTIRELEASLGREREFNASNRRINTEYLVNILRSFLMTKQATEHAKLVPVLCSILRFQPDETKAITELWAVKGGGLIGWLLPTPPVPGNITPGESAGGENQYGEYKDGIGGLDFYG